MNSWYGSSRRPGTDDRYGPLEGYDAQVVEITYEGGGAYCSQHPYMYTVSISVTNASENNAAQPCRGSHVKTKPLSISRLSDP